MAEVNPKVTSAAAGGAVSAAIVVVAAIQIMKKAWGVEDGWFSPEIVTIATAVTGGIGGFISGWAKKIIPSPE